jgi:hypothetical protein
MTTPDRHRRPRPIAGIVGKTTQADWKGFDTVTGGEMRVDEQMRAFIRKYGYYLALRKTIAGKCECVAEFAGSPDPNCPLCFGEGKRYVDHITLGRKYTPRPEIGSEQRSPLGTVHTHAPLFVVEPLTSSQDAPTTDDYIVELVLDKDLRTPKRPFQIRVAYKVTHVDEMRDLAGDVAFYQMRCEEKAWELK